MGAPGLRLPAKIWGWPERPPARRGPKQRKNTPTTSSSHITLSPPSPRCAPTVVMAAVDIPALAQLLEASLDPRQNKQGELQSSVYSHISTASALIRC